MSQNSLHQNVESNNPGLTTRKTFKFEYDEEYKCPRRVITGEIDWQGYIEASKDSTDINLIVQRANNGNNAGLNVMNGVYEDISELPSNMQDLSKFADNIRNDFDKFPDEVKKLFGDYQTFMNMTINGSVNNILADYANKIINENKEVNNADSSNS